jgi:hypothetical protein
MGVIVAGSVLCPRYPLFLFGVVGPIPFIYLTGLYVFVDFISIPQSPNLGGLISHLGGVFGGVFFITLLNSRTDLSIPLFRFFAFFQKPFRKKKNLEVVYHHERVRVKSPDDEKQKTANRRTDYRSHQEIVDDILVKIKQSGYPSLTQYEKDYLAKTSQGEFDK